jgi:hypothetical protein
MRYRRFLLGLPILSLSGLMLASCAHSPGSLGVDLKALQECRRLEHRQSLPEITADSDYRDLSAASLGELQKDRMSTKARDNCENKVMQKYKDAK